MCFGQHANVYVVRMKLTLDSIRPCMKLAHEQMLISNDVTHAVMSTEHIFTVAGDYLAVWYVVLYTPFCFS